MGKAHLTLTDAVTLAKEAEQKAAAIYGQAAQETTNPLARRLFEQLAAFEQLHYDTLVELELSLRIKGTFVEYEGVTELPVPSGGEGKHLEGTKRTSAARVLDQALQIEADAEKRYRALAEMTDDKRGRKMFERLAKEEHNHYLVIQSAYYDLANLKPVP
jgi:rubrerythrin